MSRSSGRPFEKPPKLQEGSVYCRTFSELSMGPLGSLLNCLQAGILRCIISYWDEEIYYNNSYNNGAPKTTYKKTINRVWNMKKGGWDETKKEQIVSYKTEDYYYEE